MLVAFASIVGGATMGVLYVVVPLFAGFVAVLYVLRFALEIWVWAKLTPDERAGFAAPGHFMNYNVEMHLLWEWVFFWAGFGGLILWLRYARTILDWLG